MRHLTNTLVNFLKNEDGPAAATSGRPADCIQSGRASCRISSDHFEQSQLGKGRNRRRAAATVELAVLLPFIAFLFVIAVDFARIFYFSQVIENCARQGALYASDPEAPAYNLYTSVQNAALADAQGLTPQPTVTSTTGTDQAGHAYVAVTVAWQFKTVTGFPGVPNNVNLSRTVQMRIPQQ